MIFARSVQRAPASAVQITVFRSGASSRSCGTWHAVQCTLEFAENLPNAPVDQHHLTLERVVQLLSISTRSSGLSVHHGVSTRSGKSPEPIEGSATGGEGKAAKPDYARTNLGVEQSAAVSGDRWLSLPTVGRRVLSLYAKRRCSLATAIGTCAHARQSARDRFGPRWALRRVAQRAATLGRHNQAGRRNEPGGST